MKNNKVSIEINIKNLLGLKKKKKGTLEYDLNFIINNGMEEYLKQQEEEKQKDREFIEMFKRNYDEIVKFISLDPQKRIAVDCFTCLKGMDLSKQYGKPKQKR